MKHFEQLFLMEHIQYMLSFQLKECIRFNAL